MAANRIGVIEAVDACSNTLSIVLGALADNTMLDLRGGISHRVIENKAKFKNPNANGLDLITHTAEIMPRLNRGGKSCEKKNVTPELLAKKMAI